MNQNSVEYNYLTEVVSQQHQAAEDRDHRAAQLTPISGIPTPMDLISGIDVTAGALAAQKTRLDIVAQNIANAETTRTPEGGPYQRQVVSFETELIKQRRRPGPRCRRVQVAGITTDPTPGQQIYDPHHPDAGADGMVTMPNVNLAYEMVDLITASRAYEANLSFAKDAKELAMKTLDIGK